jgi:hypothetical protein
MAMYNIITKGFNITNKNNIWELVPFITNNSKIHILSKSNGYIHFDIFKQGSIGQITIVTDNDYIVMNEIYKKICIKCNCNDIIKIIPTIINNKSKICISNIIVNNRSDGLTVSNNKPIIQSNDVTLTLIPTHNNENELNSFIIIASHFVIKIAESLSLMLKSLNYPTIISYGEISQDMINKNNSRPTEYFIILSHNLSTIVPSDGKYIIYQLEHKRKKISGINNSSSNIQNSIFSMNHSLENINNFEEQNKNKLNYFPMPIINSLQEINLSLKSNNKYDYDLLFFGSLNPRRCRIINKLKTKYNIFSTDSKYGEELYKLIRRSKIIINLHSYQEAILETARINEVLPFNKLIISELPCDADIVNKVFYEDKVVYCSRINNDLLNISSLYEQIDKYLNMETYMEYIKRNKDSITKIYENSKNKLGEILQKYNLINNELYSIAFNKEYLSQTDNFNLLYNTTKDQILSNEKIEFRYFCYRYLNYIRCIELPEIFIGKQYEAVLIEYRCFPHLEFLIRNSIIKLGSEWSHTIICGNINYEYMVNLCKLISSNIKVIKTNYDNLNQSTYSIFLASLDFWNLFTGNKILIYQEDSCIFKSNINDFIKWDYIGAPWPKNQNDNINGVGNGGFSLRTKQCMIDVINKISIEDTLYNESTRNYMKNTNMVIGPEDVYFSLNMIVHNIGKVADWDSAYIFSTESFNNIDSLGGHNFWLSDRHWRNRLYNNIIIQFKQNDMASMLEHRGGWKIIIENMVNNYFYSQNSQIDFFDIIEKHFLWDTNFYCKNKWAGVIHCTQSTPKYLNIINIQFLFANNNFIKSLDNCLFIISLSQYVADYLLGEFAKINKNVKVYVLKHPVVSDNIIYFDYDKYIKNSNKKIVQIGQQLRKMSSIYYLNLPQYEKIWLTGTKNIAKCINLLEEEIKCYNLPIINRNSVQMKYTDTFEEYDEILSINIVFIELFDASANNTVLECIIRNTPIIVNKLPAVVEYLGEEYPLYFNELSEVNDLLSDEQILSAHLYLKSIDKTDLTIDYFTKKLFSCSKFIF